MRQISILRLLTASAFVMAVLIGLKIDDLVREFLLPTALAATAAPPASAPKPAAADAVPVPVSDDERQLLQDLRGRKQELDTREAALAIREAALSAAERRLSDRVQELQDLQNKLQALQDDANQKNDAHWQDLVSVYEAMKPDAAANILNSLDMPVLLQIFDRMKDRKAAVILSDMDADRAREVTVELAKLRAVPNAQNAPNL